MRFIILLTFVLLFSSFNNSMTSMSNSNIMSVAQTEMTHDCHEEMNSDSHAMTMICEDGQSDCSNQCLMDCAQSTSFIIAKTNNTKTKKTTHLNHEILPILYQSMMSSNLFRPPIA